jgi:hypothetical protein
MTTARRPKKHTVQYAESVLKAICNAVIIMNNPLPNEIKDFLDGQARKEVQKNYESGEITSQDIGREIEELSIDIRTIHRKLAILSENGLLEHKGGRYSISPKALSDIRYFPQGFGDSALYYIGHFPIKSVDQSLVEFINRFGAFILFTFIEAARPVEDRSMNIADKDNLKSLWLQYAIPISSMFDLFLSLYGHEIKATKELHQKTIEKLTSILENKFPEIYRKMIEARSRTIEKVSARKIGSNPYSIRSDAYSFVVPKNWDKQIESN